MKKFIGKKKIGQIYINIPDIGSFSMEEHRDSVGNLTSALTAAREEFWRVYKLTRNGGSGDETRA